MTTVERARADGWKLDEACDCADPEPVGGGGNGYVFALACASCRRRLPLGTTPKYPDPDRYLVRSD